MISRVAEACFWLNRYVERAENSARLLSVNRSFVLDVDLPASERWRPIVVVAGAQQRMAQLRGETAMEDGEQVQEYLTWSKDNPVSIYSSIRWARENARTIREVISLEMWETINAFWHYLSGGPGRRQYRGDPDAVYRRVREFASLFQGIGHNTMLHEEPFDFMRLGMLLERAGWTARILDVKHHMLASLDGLAEQRALESAHSMALLRSCSATEPFFKQVQESPSARQVVAFLLLAPNLPRSVQHCLDRTENFLRRLRPDNHATGERSMALLQGLLADLRTLELPDGLGGVLHEELTKIIDRTLEICNAVHQDYFDPDFSHPQTA